ncbi:MAG: asparagine synthase (glutamine-hydrolyzing) [Acidobacteria bacterium]|nr:asparagine synthase (glutamine-hydrolyzing) [Acidobacteriota bacterium]MBV9144336.1 asparagine synthase (glutamine-hydrolyzing) [Acidobacteriota bacterium]MBV9435559.1 asparagine synthase (glutamine-hydrolyzing) [Acidobacteriota bacterium]
MCGIAGFTHSVRRLPAGVLASALRSIQHRGPDSFGNFEDQFASIGATRLRILDLEAGDQPLHSADGDTIVVFNGEIFNHRELRTQLEQAGFAFRTHCDTEVVLNGFLHWGESCFARFRGMFAIAIWIRSQRELVLARDRMGIKPLYYCAQDREIFFGSELKCLFAHPGVRRQISIEALDQFLSVNYVPGPLTLVDGILKLAPGHMLVWRNGRTRITEFAGRSIPAHTPATVDEAAQELDSLLSSAVREQLVADTPVGIWLSGGLDSSSVLHYAAQHSTRLKTFSITFKGSAGDESEHIARISKHYGTDHTEFDLNPDVDLPDALEQIAYYSDEPGADAGALPMWFLSRMTRKSATVALSGEGSDELFAGYLTYQADRYRAAARYVPRFIRRAALACALRLPAQKGRISFDYKLKRFLQGSLLSPEMAHVYWNGTHSEADKHALCNFALTGAMKHWLDEAAPRGGLQRFLDFDQRYFLADDILYKADRMSMAHSVEVRPPFLDPRIVDFAAALPEEFKLHGRTSKYVLRRLMAGKLPAEILHRPKVGFDIPAHDWFRGPLRRFLLDTLNRETVEATGLFRWPAVERLIARHLERKENAGYQLWGLMVLLLWIRRWNIELPATDQVSEVLVGDLELVATPAQLVLSSS